MFSVIWSPKVKLVLSPACQKLKFDSNKLLSLLEMMIAEIEYKDQRKLKGTC